MRAGYFAFYAGIGTYSPYLTLYYRNLGLSGPDIGVLAAIQPLATAFLAPVWGLLTDRLGIHRVVLRTALVGAALLALTMLGARSFWQFLPLIALLAICTSPTSPILDGYGVSISAQRSIPFGQIRIWGSIGYIITSWAGGWLMGGTITPLFLAAYAVTLLITCAATFGLPALKLQTTARTWRGTATVIRQPALLVLLATVFLVACSTNPSYSLFGIFLTELGGGTALIGSASALSAVSELPVMAFGGWLGAKLSARRMLALAIMVYCVRFSLYSILPSANWVLPVQLLHGLTFGLYLMSSVKLIHELLGPAYAATAQGLLSSTYAFGQITGALVAGALLDRVGIITIFRLAALVMFVALIVLLAGTRLVRVRDTT